jgi:cellulose biosynthesis operon protein BcsF/YhjT
MNYQQVFGLIAACAVVMLPLGALFGVMYRWVLERVRGALRPRYLKSMGIRLRTGTPVSGARR